MSGTAPSLMFEHMLDPKKGWPSPYALDYDAKISANVTFDLPRGRVVHLNSSGEFETGVDQTSMGIFLFPGAADFDVNNPGTTAAGHFMHQQIAPTGKVSGLVAKGAYELESTEYDTAQVYVPGDLLTATVANTNATTGGRMTNVGTGAHGDVKQYVDPVCGVVSHGTRTNEHGVSVLRFWPEWLPGVYA
jgi:hypothetical protein